MPIRMTDDPKDSNQNDYNDDQGSGGGRSNFPGGSGGGGGLRADANDNKAVATIVTFDKN